MEFAANDAVAAHAEVELGVDQEESISPWIAAISCITAFAMVHSSHL
ncbi:MULTISPECIES: hypothetical protein [Brevibacterium]|uniref:Uncharacterized protein n=1 Tax=Brevibacterium koreense TaxID=3140787 RepID=A0AAU7UHY1_9MICO|nr:hypothetical protein [Brevibacterium antiquum]